MGERVNEVGCTGSGPRPQHVRRGDDARGDSGAVPMSVPLLPPLAGDSAAILHSAMVRGLGAIEGSCRCDVAQPTRTSGETRSWMNELDLYEVTLRPSRRGLARRPVA
jgi:hypothetical protein